MVKINERLSKWLLWILLAILFTVISGGLNLLYSGNQTAYFSYGLADGGMGYLSQDWFSNTQDPFPVFSFVVKNTYQYLGEGFFYVYQVILNGVFLFSIVGIIDHHFNLRRSKLRFASFILIYFIAVSLLWPLDSRKTLFDGLANQFFGFEALLPNSFGAFQFLSLYLYLKDKPAWAVVSLVVSGYFHTGFLLISAVLVLGYMVNEVFEHRRFKRAFAIGAAAFILVLPIVIYYLSTNQNATPDQIGQASQILVQIRIVQHALVAEWWGLDAVVKFLIMILAVFATYRTRLFPVLVIGLAGVAGATIFTAVHPSNFVSGLQIWRISVFLVPLSSAFLIAKLFDLFKLSSAEAYKSGLLILALAGVCAVGLYLGAVEQLHNIQWPQDSESWNMMTFVQQDAQPGDLYLIPQDDIRLEVFRFKTGVPIVVNWKGFPWNALDALEWNQRYQKASRFYSLDGEKACEQLAKIQDDYGITHVVLSIEDSFGCAAEEIYADSNYKVYQIEP